MLQLSQCKLSWQEDSFFLNCKKKAAKLLGISVEDFTQFTIVKTQSGCQKKSQIFLYYIL